MSNSQLVVPSAQTNQIPYNVGNIKNPIINLRPSNPLPEDFAEMQKFGPDRGSIPGPLAP